MRDISLHVMDIAENSVKAGATRVTVRVKEDRKADVLVVEIEDDGEGMDGHTVAQALDPFFTTAAGKRFGLGLPLFCQAAREAGGNMRIDSTPGMGTRISAFFKLSHPDRKPLGDMEKTMRLLGCAHPDVDFRYHRAFEEGQGEGHEAHAG